MKRLLLMSGIHHPEGWVTLDAKMENNPDVVAVLPTLPKVIAQELWDEVNWIHGITSLYPWDAATVLSQLRHIMAPNSLLVLEQPNYLTTLTTQWPVEWVFGDPLWRDPLHMNKWAYTPNSLADAVRSAGFTRVEILPAQHHNPARDFRLEARP